MFKLVDMTLEQYRKIVRDWHIKQLTIRDIYIGNWLEDRHGKIVRTWKNGFDISF